MFRKTTPADVPARRVCALSKRLDAVEETKL